MTLNRQAIRQEFNREMTKARERITTTANGEIGWLVQFIQLDLDTLTPSEWMVLAYEVASFTEVDFSQKHVFPVVSSCGWSVQALPGETHRVHPPESQGGDPSSTHDSGLSGGIVDQRRRADHLFGSDRDRHPPGCVPRSLWQRPGGDQTQNERV